MEEVELKHVFMILRKRIGILLLVTAILVVVTGFISYFVLKPEYKATTTLLVAKTQDDGKPIEYSDILLYEKLVSTYGEIIKSRMIASEVIENLGLNMRYEDINEMVNVSLKKETELIVVEVKSTDPVFATKIANEIGNVFINNVRFLIKTNNVQLVDRAVVPTAPTTPKPGLNMLIVGIIGIFVGTVIILIYENLQNTLKSVKEVEDCLDISVLGVIPKDKRLKRIRKGDKDKNIIFNNDDNSFYSEAYKSLRTNLQFSFINQKIKSIVITSPEPGDGKSTLVSNLAINLSRIGYKVLLMDTDLRNPKIHEIFRLLNYNGITNVLMGDIEYKEAINTLSPGYPDVLTSGPVPHNPSEMLSSERMKSLMIELQQNYDVVLLDTPSAALVSDAAILSSIADSAIVVYASDKTKVEMARNLKTSLMKSNINILGAVLNKAPIKTMDYKNIYNRKYFSKSYLVRSEMNLESDIKNNAENESNKQSKIKDDNQAQI